MKPITCIGNANIDAFLHVPEAFLSPWGIVKGDSTVLAAETLARLLAGSTDFTFFPGGCAANTACGLANLGVPVRFVGKIGPDQYGAAFAEDFTRFGVDYDVAAHATKPTSLCLTFVTPDRDRSFAYNTDNASRFLSLADFTGPVEKGGFVYVEGYLVQADRDNPAGNLLRQLITRHAKTATIILNLNEAGLFAAQEDVDCVLANVDVLIGNRKEFQAFMRAGTDFASAIVAALKTGRTFIVTDGAGSVVCVNKGIVTTVAVPSVPQDEVIDTVGAGDQFVAGFLSRYLRDEPLTACCEAGIAAAAAIVRQAGPRPASLAMANGDRACKS